MKYNKRMNRFREVRKSRGYTQKDVARHTGIAQSSISQYESGKRSPQLDIVITLAKFYNVCIDFFVGADLCENLDLKRSV